LESTELLIERGSNPNEKDTIGRMTPLHFACQYGNPETASYLLKKSKVDPDPRDLKGRTPFHLSCKNAHSSCIEILLNHGANINSVDDEKMTGLLLAIQQGNEAVVELLLNKGANYEQSAIDMAIEKRHRKIVELIVMKESYPDGQWTPLQVASRKGYLHIMKFLLEYEDVDVNAVEETYMWSALHCATESGHLKCIQWLLKKGADKDKQARDGSTPLHIACFQGNANCLYHLLTHEANSALRDAEMRTPLHLAVLAGQTQCVRLMLSSRAIDKNALWIGNMTSLHITIIGGYVDGTALLLDHLADTSLRDVENRTPLHLAIQASQIECARLLLSSETVDVDALWNENMTSLHLAIENGDADSAALLLDHHADTTLRDAENRTPLHLAIQAGQVECVRTLLSRQEVDINALWNGNMTSLHIAIDCGNVDCVGLLLDHHADISLRDMEDRTPLQFAVQTGQTRCVEVLEAWDDTASS